MVESDTMLLAQYLTAIAGLGALRQCVTNPSAVRARLDDIIRIVEAVGEPPNNLEIPIREYDVEDAYAWWASSYDNPTNPAIEAEEPAMRAYLADAPRGRALDVGCGTGRHAAHLLTLGYEVVGIDQSAAMLDVARAKLPDTRFELGRFDALPVDDESFDVVTCSLALTHTPSLDQPIREMARVLKPGGWLLLSDLHPVSVLIGGTALFPDPEAPPDRPTLAHTRNLYHPLSTYIAAITGADLRVVDCREIPMPESAIADNPVYPLIPEAVTQAFEGIPFILTWQAVKP